MTITEKILARHAGKCSVYPNELLEVRVDLALANDITAPLAIKVFRQMGGQKVFDPERIVLVSDHFVPNKDISSAQQVKTMKTFAGEQGIRNYYELSEGGVEHVILPEKGLVLPGDLVIGADSHSCTYGALGAFSAGVGSTDLAAIMAGGKVWLKVPASIKIILRGEMQRWVRGKDLILYIIAKLGVDGATYKSIEFSGPVIQDLSMDQRFTMANMAVETGAKNGIFAPDHVTRAYISERSGRAPLFLTSDENAFYERVLEIDVDGIGPLVAFPHSPDNVRPLSEVEKIPLDQVFLGSCTNGRLEDLREAAAVLKSRTVAKGTRLIVLPGSSLVYAQALGEGLLNIIVAAGGVIGPPCCGPCLGGHMGILAAGEKGLSTSNRNFRGRMGHPESEVYLSNPAIAAASAILGRIGSPEEL